MVVLEEGGVSTLAPRVPAPPVPILFEDDALVVVQKPAGLPTQPTMGRAGDSVLDVL